MTDKKMIQSNGKTVLVTDGAGYIGSHCTVVLQEAGYKVIALDNFNNSKDDGNGGLPFIVLKKLRKFLCNSINNKSDSVIHFAAMKNVKDSMESPLLYYRNNIIGLINLLEVMEKFNIFNLAFSSSCTKRNRLGIQSVYGRTKYIVEDILKDISASNEKWNIISLRYFNPVGAHESDLIGEDPIKQFRNIIPFLAQVAMGKREYFTIFGNDYDTPDNSGIRDYTHVMDLAAGHVCALQKLEKSHVNINAYNLGAGRGVSVLELINTFEKTNNVKIPYKFEARRAGDVPMIYADPSLAKRELGWKATRSLEQMCSDFWRWQTMNFSGYQTELRNGNNH
ncbi:UDP-glucose 4-epimerase [Pseudolycoriella hygida]|uniref:UDP-glucose 4-epimerase n=1 Tax=Pseudolycoriella hygida TaxID=35572 RepID=A0A9Q0N3P5_9DIPT|nr:UDP-glucose 4-epimerase [Pseudolycoriella hygida]